MKAKNVVLVLAATGLISSQAFAAESDVKAPSSPRTQSAFTEADASALFEGSGKPMQVAELSSAEMKGTEGALGPGGALIGGGIGAIGNAGAYAFEAGISPSVDFNWVDFAHSAAEGAVVGALAGSGAAALGASGMVVAAGELAAANINLGSRIASGVIDNYQ